MYDIYISDMLLPIPPQKITLQINGKHETATLISEGEISILKSPGLSTVSFTALLPNVRYPFAQYPNGFRNASYYLDKLESLKNTKQPFQFIVARKTPVNKKLFNTNLTVFLQSYQVVDNTGNGFDTEVQINLKEFKAYGTKTFTVTTPSETAPIIVQPARTPSTTPTSSGPSGSGGNGGGSSIKTYKVQIPGMGALSIKASSIQEAITKAMGSNWTGTVYVDGVTYYVEKGILSTPPAPKTPVPAVVQQAVNAVKTTVNNYVAQVKTNPVKTIASTVAKVTSAVRAATPVVKKVASALSNIFRSKK